MCIIGEGRGQHSLGIIFLFACISGRLGRDAIHRPVYAFIKIRSRVRGLPMKC
jgi:hypothetical protein